MLSFSEKETVKEVWRLNCEQITQYNAEYTVKDLEIANLKWRIWELEMQEPFTPLQDPIY